MIGTLRHRGPDGRGVYLDRNCGLAHARLSILDLAGGAQPMELEGGGLVITFNGEIFNYLELRAELEQQHGRALRLALGHRDDPARLRGLGRALRRAHERPVGLRDLGQQRERLFCARDRIGVRPFFWTLFEGRFLFGSEVKALFAVPGVTRELDLCGLDEVLTFWCAVAPRTVWQGIRELPPGCTLTIDARASGARKPEIRRYWQLDYTIDESRSARRARERAPRAARRRDAHPAARRRAGRRLPLRRARFLGDRGHRQAPHRHAPARPSRSPSRTPTSTRAPSSARSSTRSARSTRRSTRATR